MKRRQFFQAVAAASATAAVASPAFAAGHSQAVSTGAFEGRSNHVTTGSVSLIEEDGRFFIELGEDFSLDGGPDPRVGFGRDGVYDPDAYLGALLSLTGKQRYAVPITWDPAQFSDVFIWCEVASVPLGVASLN